MASNQTFIRSYGMYWRREEVNWSPGRGNHQNGSQLLGRTGLRKPALQVADFWEQRRIYVLYDDYGPH